MLSDRDVLDTGTKRLLELGIRQQLRRPLEWTQSTMICFCILSSITCITGESGLAALFGRGASEDTSLLPAGLYSQGLIYGGEHPTMQLLEFSFAYCVFDCTTAKLSLLSFARLSVALPVGPVVLVWGWVCAGTLHTLVGLAMSELCSAFPVSGGLYFWSFMLSEKHGLFASWIVGWLNLLGQCLFLQHTHFACCDSGNRLFSSQEQSCIPGMDNCDGFSSYAQPFVSPALYSVGHCCLNECPMSHVSHNLHARQEACTECHHQHDCGSTCISNKPIRC